MTQTKAQLLGPVHNNIAGDVNFDSNTLFVDSANNRLGIGTNSPSVALHVIGDITMRDNSPRLEMHDANAANNLSCTGGIELFDSAGNRGAYMGATEGANFLSFGISSTAGAAPTEKLRITSDGNVNINGTPPWSVTGGNYRNLSISGNDASSSGFLWLGNGAAATNADFDLGRINYVNGSNIVAQIKGTTQTGAIDDGRISFMTKESGSNISEKLRITSTGDILPGGNKTQDLGSSSNNFANVYAGNIELSDDYPSIKPSLNLNFAGARALDSRITFTRASTGTYVGRSGLIETAGDDEPRFDHDPVTLESLGLLIEESRTNYVNNSTNHSSWVSVASAVNETTYPIKGLATTRLTDSPSDGDSPYLTCDASGWSTGSSTAMSMSIYVDAVNSTSDTITLYLFGGGYIAHTWNISTGVPVATESFSLNGTKYSNGSQEIIDCGGGIYRLILKATYNGTTTTAARFYLAPSGGATDYVIIAGPQIERGVFATSLIPTSGSSATRAADTAKIEGNSFTDWYNPLESTIYFESSTAPTSNSKYFTFHGNDGGGIELIESSAVSGPGASVFTYYNSSVQSNISVTDSGATKLKYATGVEKNNVNVAVNGTLGTADTSATQPDALSELVIGNYNSGSYYLNTTIQKLVYYPKRLTDAQLQLLTS